MEATTECKPVSEVSWELEQTDYAPTGFAEELIKESKIKFTIDKKVLVFSEDNNVMV